MSPGRPAPTVVAVRDVPWWGLLSSGAAPVLVVGGWMAATSLQPQSVDPVAETVSALAAVDAAERWVMTVTFLAVGVCCLPSPGQSGVGPAACAARTRSGVNGGPSYTPAAARPRAITVVSLGSSGRIAPRAGRRTAKVPAQREPVGPAGADQGP